ncbi:hypothetical protein M2275_006000 [Rhodococcus opacus]|nr:hypothetical protein [Rhodococcus opacus]
MTGQDDRIIGGQLVHILSSVYPTSQLGRV